MLIAFFIYQNANKSASLHEEEKQTHSKIPECLQKPSIASDAGRGYPNWQRSEENAASCSFSRGKKTKDVSSSKTWEETMHHGKASSREHLCLIYKHWHNANHSNPGTLATTPSKGMDQPSSPASALSAIPSVTTQLILIHAPNR